MLVELPRIAPMSLDRWTELVKPVTSPTFMKLGPISLQSIDDEGSDISAMKEAFEARKLWALVTDVSDGNDSQYLVPYGHKLPAMLSDVLVEGYIYAHCALTQGISTCFPVVPFDFGLDEALYSCYSHSSTERCFVRESSAEAALAYFENEFEAKGDSLELHVDIPSFDAMIAAGTVSAAYAQAPQEHTDNSY